MESQTARRSYDHRLKALVAKSKNPYLFKELSIITLEIRTLLAPYRIY